MRKKRTSDTTSGAVALLQDALQGPPPPPAELRDDAVRCWFAIVGDRPAGDWSDLQLTLAEMAACAMADVFELQRILSREGMVIITRTGIEKPHPGVAALDSATRRQLALLRALGMGADNSRDSRQRAEGYKRARVIAGQLAAEPFLAQ